jgi:hypothetical protein
MNFEQPENNREEKNSSFDKAKHAAKSGVLGLASLLATSQSAEAQLNHYWDPKEPVYVESAEDPRYQAYQDSLNLWKAYQFQVKNMNAEPVIREMAESIDVPYEQLKEIREKNYLENVKNIGPDDYSYESIKKDPTQGYDTPDERAGDNKIIDYYKSLDFHGDVAIGEHSSPDLAHKTIRPTGEYYDGLSTSPIYRRPEQPVFIEGTSEAESTHKQEQLKEAGLYDGSIDGVWGKKSERAWQEYEQNKEQQNENATKKETIEEVNEKIEGVQNDIDEMFKKPKPKNSISFEPETVNLSGTKGQYVYYDSTGYPTPITKTEFERLKNQGVEEVE